MGGSKAGSSLGPDSRWSLSISYLIPQLREFSLDPLTQPSEKSTRQAARELGSGPGSGPNSGPSWALIPSAENEGLDQTNPVALGESEVTWGKPNGPQGRQQEETLAKTRRLRATRAGAGRAQAVKEA